MDQKDVLVKNNRLPSCLNLIRLIGALQVVCGHCINNLNTKVSEPVEKMIYYFRGVPIFFILSGYLIWQSVNRSNSYSEYLKKRFWRLFPELWLGVFIEIITIVLLYRDYKILDLLLFAVTQATILQFWTPSSLRGYGCGTPNGALWTIGVLIQFYIVVWFVYKYLHKKSYKVWSVTIVILIAISAVSKKVLPYIAPSMIKKLYGQTMIPYLWIFLLGAFIAQHKDKVIQYIAKWWYILLVISLVAYVFGIDIDAYYTVFANGLMSVALIGFAYAFPKLEIKTDISYGIYIYHMTIMNAFIVFSLDSKIHYIPIIIVLSCLIAWLTTKTIGIWSKNRKERINNG